MSIDAATLRQIARRVAGRDDNFARLLEHLIDNMGGGASIEHAFVGDASTTAVDTTTDPSEPVITLTIPNLPDEAGISVIFQLSQAHITALKALAAGATPKIRLGLNGEIRAFRVLRNNANSDVLVSDLPTSPIRYQIVTAGPNVNCFIFAVQYEIT